MGCDRCIQCISRAILKPVHQFGIPNSDPKTPKSIKINSSKNRQTTVHALVPQCFELFKMQYSQKFSGPSPLDQSGEGLQCTPSHLCLQTSQLHKGFCPHQVCQKASTPPPPQKKMLDTALAPEISLSDPNNVTESAYYIYLLLIALFICSL